MAEIRSDSAKKTAEKVKAVDVAPPSIPTTTSSTTMTARERDQLIAEEEARIEAAKKAQLEKISKEQEKARLAAEKDAQKARQDLERKAERPHKRHGKMLRKKRLMPRLNQ